MEEKKTIKVSFVMLFLIIAIIVVIIMACYIFIDKTNSNKKIAELEADITNMQSTLNSLQEENNNNIIVNSEKNNDLNDIKNKGNEIASFSDEQVKTTLSNFLELRAHANCDSLLENLTQKGKLNYNSSQDIILNDGTVVTTIKFSDYRNAMLNYVSENEFESNWKSSQYFSENDSGYLTKIQGGGALNIYTIKSITKNGELNYIAETSYITDITEADNTYNEKFSFTVKKYNGNCVIDTIE